MGRQKSTKKSRKRKRGVGGSDDRPCKLNSAQAVSVSETLHAANTVLYDNLENNSLNDSVFITSTHTNFDTMASGGESDSSSLCTPPNPNPTRQIPADTLPSGNSPSSADILNYLKQMDQRIMAIDGRLSVLDSLEKKVDIFEGEMKKLWAKVNSENKSLNEKTNRLSDELESLQFTMNETQEDIIKLKKDKVNLEDDLLYVQSQSMRDNLIFTNIEESMHEKTEDCEGLLRQFMVQKLKLAQDVVDRLRFERVHRIGAKMDSSSPGKPRQIVAKFSTFKDREMIRRSRINLKGTDHVIFEQYPKIIADRRKSLRPKLKKAIQDGKRAWISYDTLFVNGKPVRDDNQ